MICFFLYSWSRCVDHDIYLLIIYILDFYVSTTIRFFVFLSFFMHNIYFYVCVERGDHAWYASSPLIWCHLLLIQYSWSGGIHHDMTFLIIFVNSMCWSCMICFSINFVSSSPHIFSIFVISMCPSWYASPNILDLVEIMAHDMLLHWFRAIHDESSLFCGGYARHRANFKFIFKASYGILVSTALRWW